MNYYEYKFRNGLRIMVDPFGSQSLRRTGLRGGVTSHV